VIAFGRRVILWLHKERVVGARLSTGLASDAASVVEIDDAVLARVERRHRTDLDARSVGAVIAPHDGKKPPRVGKLAFFDVFDPGAVDADGDLVLGFAGNGAGVAADALSVVDYEAKVHGVCELNLDAIKNCEKIIFDYRDSINDGIRKGKPGASGVAVSSQLTAIS
ncbi:MAG TPA: hypothetical protein PKO33_04280, partial [Pyrinomonadaceae bacterium]|nr:hypothetical protein [Pyrinomonadaceae bacterium]